MAKTTGLGHRLLVGGVDISGDVTALDEITGSIELLENTGIDKSAKERIGGLRDGLISSTSWFNPTGAHAVLSDLPTSDVHTMYLAGAAIGDPAACMVAQQGGYAGTREDDGSLTHETEHRGSGFGLEWGELATPGIDTVANQLTGQSTTFEGGIGSWVLDGAATVAASSAQARTGTGSLAITATGTSDAGARHAGPGTSGIVVTPGRQYLIQAWFRAATTARTVRAVVAWYTSGGSAISVINAGSATDSTSGWTLAAGVLAAPATAAFAIVKGVAVTPGGAGEVHYLDDVSFAAMPTALDGLAASTFGLQAHLQVTAFTGTDATITLHSSSDDGAADAYSAITGGAFTAVTAVGAQRIATAGGQPVERYLRPVVTTTGGFTALSYVVVVVRNLSATVF